MGSAAITLQMQPTGTAYVKSMQGNSWPQSIIVVFEDEGGKPVDLTGSVPRIFAGPNGAYADGTVMDAFSGTAQFGVTPEMTAVPGQYACSFSLPNTSCPDFRVDRLTLKAVLQQDGVYYAFLNQVPGMNEDIQTQLNNIRTELTSKITEQDVQTAIGGVTVGAVQLLRDSATLPTLHGWSQNSSTDSADAGGGFYRLPLSSDITEILQNTGVTTIHGATYTESFYFRTDSTTLGFSFNFYELNHEKSNIVQAVVRNMGSGLYRAWATATVEDTAIRAIDIRDLVYTDGTYIEIGKPKFEYGNKATDYSESDADFNDRIGTINQTLTEYTSEISQNAKDITLRVLTSTYDTYTAANDSAVSGAANAAATAQSTATGAASAASAAQSTATGAASAASSAQNAASSAQSTANSKAKVFTGQPSPPYAAGDVWKNGSAVFVCLTARGSGSFTASDWSLSGDVTANNTAADTAKVGGTSSATVLNNISTAQTAAGNAGAAAGAAQSAANNAASAASTAQGTANNAATAAAEAQSTANSKAKVFTAQPTPPYSVGDLWTNSAGDTMVCKTARSSGSYTASDWQPASAVTVTRIQTAEQKITPQAITSTVASNITGDQIASIINQSATTVSISAQKVDLTGYVTLTNLSTQGQTVINGANITTGTISANRIDTTNLKAQKIYNASSSYYASIGSVPFDDYNFNDGSQVVGSGITMYDSSGMIGALVSAKQNTPDQNFDSLILRGKSGSILMSLADHYSDDYITNDGSKFRLSMYNPSNPNYSTDVEMIMGSGDTSPYGSFGSRGPTGKVMVSYDTIDRGFLGFGAYLNDGSFGGINLDGNFPTAPLNSATWHNENEGYWDTYVTRIGNMCFVYGNIAGGQLSSYNVVMSVPKEFRPPKRTSVNTFNCGNSTGVRFDVLTNGNIIYISTGGAMLSGWIGLNFFYSI